MTLPSLLHLKECTVLNLASVHHHIRSHRLLLLTPSCHDVLECCALKIAGQIADSLQLHRQASDGIVHVAKGTCP